MHIKNVLWAVASATAVRRAQGSAVEADFLGGPKISQSQLDSLKFYAQHAGAAYCNFNTRTGQPITCRANACPSVEANDVKVIDSVVGVVTGVGAYVAVDKKRREIVMSVRGSNNIRNFVTDVVFAQEPCHFVAGCKIHTGFNKGWNEIQSVATRAVHTAHKENPSFRIIATGHSLGAAVTTLGAAYLRQDGLPVEIYSYGSPRIGNTAFAGWMTVQKGIHMRVTHFDDPVPRVPPIILGYNHISPEYWLSGGGPLREDYSADQIRTCLGLANTLCNGGTLGFDVLAHLHYLGNTAGCTGNPLLLKRGDSDWLNETLEERFNRWSVSDRKFAANMTQNAGWE
ncbi:hypothetical protein QQS21_009047 [Conoideocrella luteorostrata]|uniref:Lipase n=1 Tax=Conoideocrella luteorostrata TaxID=1105319 RepID=A0AAJ0FVZ7_9HYPO|nr:hypothetical protein QQS21_009047 [Conoideocrella luteorostrata]